MSQRSYPWGTQERKLEKNLKKPIFYRKPLSQKPIPNIVSMGYTGKIMKKTVIKKFP